MKTRRKPRRSRRILKWVGAGICALLICLSWASAHWWLAWINENSTLALEISRGTGVLGYDPIGQTAQTMPPGWHFQSEYAKYRWWFRWHWKSGGPSLIVVPLWVPLLLLAVPTAVLFYRDRRRIPPGHCRKCGYNLTGNASGVCPECGAKIAHNAEVLDASIS